MKDDCISITLDLPELRVVPEEERLPPEERPCQFVSIREVSSLLRVSQRIIRRLVKNGEPRYWLQRMVCTRWSDIHHLLGRAYLPQPSRR